MIIVFNAPEHEVIEKLKAEQVKYIKQELQKYLKDTLYDLKFILTKSHVYQLVKLRHTLMYYLRTDLNLTLKEIGIITNRDHTTVMNGLKQIEYLLNTIKDPFCISFLNHLRANEIKWIVQTY